MDPEILKGLINLGVIGPFVALFAWYIVQKDKEIKEMRVEFSVIKSGYYEGIGFYKEAMETMMVVQDEKSFSTQHKYYLANLYEKEKKFTESTALVMTILETEPKKLLLLLRYVYLV